MMGVMVVARATEVTASSRKSFDDAITQVPYPFYVFPPNDSKWMTAYYYAHEKTTLSHQQPTAPPPQTGEYKVGVG